MSNACADVVELADTRDLKSLGGDFVPVQARSSAPDGGLLVCRKKTDGLRPSFFYVSLSLAAFVPMTRAVRNMDARRGAGQTRAGSSLFRHSLRLLLTSPVICYPPAACLYAAKKTDGLRPSFFYVSFLVV